MKNKKKRINYYLLSFIILIIVMFIMDNVFEGIIGDYMEKNILQDTEKVKTSTGYIVTRGNFHWLRLRDFLIKIALLGFLIMEIVIYITNKLTKKKTAQETINTIEERIKRVTENQIPYEDDRFKLIDRQIEDIMNENEKNRQLIELEMAKKNDLVTYLAHDLKTPLTTIIGYLTLLQDKDIPEHIKQKYIKTVLEKSYRMEDLTNQFFDITRFNLQEIPMDIKCVDFEFFMIQLVDEFYPQMKEKHIQIKTDIQEGMTIWADGNLLARVLNNILKNAIAYSYENTEIRIVARDDKEHSTITITNFGENISWQELELIFQKFYRRDQSRGHVGGSGLGLAIAKEIIEKHGGVISAKSVDGETSFMVTLPKSS